MIRGVYACTHDFSLITLYVVVVSLVRCGMAVCWGWVS